MIAPTPDVLTDVPGLPGRFWGDRTTFVGPARPTAWLCQRVGWALAHDLGGEACGPRLAQEFGQPRSFFSRRFPAERRDAVVTTAAILASSPRTAVPLFDQPLLE